MRSQLRDDSRTNTYTIQMKKHTFIEGRATYRDTREYSRRSNVSQRIVKSHWGTGIKVISGNNNTISCHLLIIDRITLFEMQNKLYNKVRKYGRVSCVKGGINGRY